MNSLTKNSKLILKVLSELKDNTDQLKKKTMHEQNQNINKNTETKKKKLGAEEYNN